MTKRQIYIRESGRNGKHCDHVKLPKTTLGKCSIYLYFFIHFKFPSEEKIWQPYLRLYLQTVELKI